MIGGELRKRIEGIMTVAAVTVPFAFTIVSARAQPPPQPFFDVASVKMNRRRTRWRRRRISSEWNLAVEAHWNSTPCCLACGVSGKCVEGVEKDLRASDIGFDIVASQFSSMDVQSVRR